MVLSLGTRLRPLLASGLSIALCACGGGGPAERTGSLLRGAVGIAYTTPTRSGVTDANGGFKYLDGETVSFAIGAIDLGSAPAAAELDLFDLSGVVQPPVDRVALFALISTSIEPDHQVLENVAARARVLFSLDADADPSNGVQIDQATREHFATLTVPLQSGSTMPGVGAFPAQLRDWSIATGLPARPLMATGLALALAYETAGLDPAIKSVARQRTDQGADGSIEYETSYTYDGDGNRTSQLSLNADGAVSAQTVEQWGANKNRELLERDRDGDGAWDEIWDYQYNAFGDVTANSRRDGSGELLSEETNEYDERGRRVLRSWQSFESGSGGGGRWSYPEDGVTEAFDSSGRLRTITYRNTLGAIERVERMDPDDGSVSSITTHEYDARWRLTSKRVTSSSGMLRSEERREYTPGGGLSLLWNDTNGDGVAESIDRRSYDAQGYMSVRERDADADGRAEQRHEWLHSAAGLLTEYRRFDEGELAYELASTYDASGVKLSEVYDVDGDGTIDTRTDYVADADGYLSEARTDADGDGLADSIRYWTWEPNVISAWYLF
ncbi:MAG: hypothetical protein AAF515_09170 [Pseudomonadota bacterium]